MSVYDVNGNIISTAYDVNDNVLSSLYDVNGNVIQDDYVPVDINDIPSYWHQEISYTLDYVDSFNDDYVHYLVVTDSHFQAADGRVNRSADIANYLMENGNFSKLLLLGDNANSGTETDGDYLKLLNSKFNKQNQRGKLLALRGNHDSNISPSVFYDDFMSHSRATLDSSYSWMIDDPTYKIRIIGMPNNDTPNTNYLQRTIATLPNDYSLLILNHYNFSEPNPEWVMNLNKNSSRNIISLLRESNIPLIGYWCGHQHLDDLSLIDGGIYQMIFMCDAFDGVNFYDYYDYPPRARDGYNSMTGQALTVASVNTKTKDIRFYRIGNCHNEDYKNWSYTYGTTIPDSSLVILDITTGLIPDVYVTAGGGQASYEGWSATDYIDVSQYSEVQLFSDGGLVGSFVQNFCYWFDSNKSPVDTLRFGALQANTTSNFVTIPDGVKYFRLSDATDNITNHIFVRARIKSVT